MWLNKHFSQKCEIGPTRQDRKARSHARARLVHRTQHWLHQALVESISIVCNSALDNKH